MLLSGETKPYESSEESRRKANLTIGLEPPSSFTTTSLGSGYA